MKTSSCKAKGRGFQDKIRDMYREIGKEYGLVDGDIVGRQMGGAGEDIVFSPKALTIFPHAIECKKHKSVGVPKHFAKHYTKYKSHYTTKLLFHENDRSEALVTLRAQDFIDIVSHLLELNK